MSILAASSKAFLFSDLDEFDFDAELSKAVTEQNFNHYHEKATICAKAGLPLTCYPLLGLAFDGACFQKMTTKRVEEVVALNPIDEHEAQQLMRIPAPKRPASLEDLLEEHLDNTPLEDYLETKVAIATILKKRRTL